ncbi:MULTISPECIES: hypothetical protein [Rhodococcus]|uniref:Uncharacterized protein n=1 Tax=Rhodococcus jostii (strain RHA1) TaxID=101510 RepID=Q0S9R1_RHOJR|nr:MULTISPECIES: hypothetical protein [Rhodococcus]ABG95725.1 hypothetical protein RHA1_ro03925 [Rhodococcus jostii RHA1]
MTGCILPDTGQERTCRRADHRSPARPSGGRHDRPTTLATGLGNAFDVAVSGGTHYVTEFDSGTVVALPAAGGTVLATGLDQPFSVAAAAACTGSLCIPFGC